MLTGHQLPALLVGLGYTAVTQKVPLMTGMGCLGAHKQLMQETVLQALLNLQLTPYS